MISVVSRDRDRPKSNAIYAYLTERGERMRRKIGWLTGPLLGVAIAQAAIADTCPITECNYLDPQYQAASAQFTTCMNGVTTNFEKYMGFLAISYPRFGIAWNALGDEAKAAMHADGTIDEAAIKAAQQRFNDRLIGGAESEAVSWYNMYMTKMRANPQPCGLMPQPPKGQPAPLK
jgi:hypothetical protein